METTNTLEAVVQDPFAAGVRRAQLNNELIVTSIKGTREEYKRLSDLVTQIDQWVTSKYDSAEWQRFKAGYMQGMNTQKEDTN